MSTDAGPPVLRPLRWWDVEAAAALEVELFGPTAWSAELFWSELAAPGRTYLAVGEADGPLLGYAGLALADGEADVQTLAVAPAAQGRGLGRALLRALLESARGAGASSVLLEVAADNGPARGLYAAEGFVQIAVRRAYYQPTGTDALVLRRRLP